MEVVAEISPYEETNFALPLLIKQSYAANNIVVVDRHREGALKYANDNLACLPLVEYPTRTDQDLYKLDTRNITVN